MRSCLERGIGFTICPEVSVLSELKGGSLSKIRWDAEYEETSVIMIWHAEKWCSPLLRHFMKISEDVISD